MCQSCTGDATTERGRKPKRRKSEDAVVSDNVHLSAVLDSTNMFARQKKTIKISGKIERTDALKVCLQRN